MYRNVLIPTDGADGTRRAIDEGVGIAAEYGAAVHALYVVDVSEYSTLTQREALGLRGERESVGQEAVAAVAARAEATGVEVTTAVERGVPHRAILDYAEKRGVDLIVMATHGRTGIDRFLLGSVTEKVVRAADAPVLVVRMGEERGEQIDPGVDEA